MTDELKSEDGVLQNKDGQPGKRQKRAEGNNVVIVLMPETDRPAENTPSAASSRIEGNACQPHQAPSAASSLKSP